MKALFLLTVQTLLWFSTHSMSVAQEQAKNHNLSSLIDLPLIKRTPVNQASTAQQERELFRFPYPPTPQNQITSASQCKKMVSEGLKNNLQLYLACQTARKSLWMGLRMREQSEISKPMTHMPARPQMVRVPMTRIDTAAEQRENDRFKAICSATVDYHFEDQAQAARLDLTVSREQLALMGKNIVDKCFPDSGLRRAFDGGRTTWEVMTRAGKLSLTLTLNGHIEEIPRQIGCFGFACV